MVLTSLAFAAVLFQGESQATGLKKLDLLLGQWESKEVTKGPNGDIEFTLKGVNKWGLGDTALLIDEQFEIQGRKFENHIVVRYDGPNKRYVMYWHSLGTPDAMLFHGTFTAEKTLVFEGVAAPKPNNYKIVYNFLEPGHYKAQLEIKRGDSYEVATRAEYTRVKP